jgi:serine/threonine protein kinase
VSSRSETKSQRSNYRLLGLVGQGQFGRVFCAVHRQTGQLVALKELDRQRFSTRNFLRELRFLLSLQHPNIVNCQALEHTATGRYLVMDYCHGGTLRKLMAEETRVSLSQSLKLVADVLRGLDHAHSRGIVHCDIKPENILLNVEPNGWSAHISDFGIARLHQEKLSQDGNTGSPAYMAPERFYGQYSPTSDLYSVGIILFEWLAGYRPFSGTPADLMSAHLNQPLQIPDTIPAALHPLITTALQKLSARRFQSAKDMLAALQAIVQTTSFTDSERLLHSTTVQPVFPLQAQQQEPISTYVTALAIVPQSPNTTAAAASVAVPQAYLCRAERHQLDLQILSEANAAPSTHRWSFSFKDPVRSLFPCPQGCFVASYRSLDLIAVPPAAGSFSSPQLIPVYRSAQDVDMVIDPQGQWLTTMAHQPTTNEPLQIWRLTPAAVLLSSLPLMIWRPDRQAIAPSQLLALGSRHIAVIADRLGVAANSSVMSDEPIDLTGSAITVLTRRGQGVGAINLPISLGTAWTTANRFQIMAIDRPNPGVIALIDLKPYRIVRLHVGIQPAFISSTVWGTVLADIQGNLVFFDREWQQVGHLLTAATITAITFLDPYRLLIAIWQEQQGSLQLLNIKDSQIELLF